MNIFTPLDSHLTYGGRKFNWLTAGKKKLIKIRQSHAYLFCFCVGLCLSGPLLAMDKVFVLM
jgi:hypothetical protein